MIRQPSANRAPSLARRLLALLLLPLGALLLLAVLFDYLAVVGPMRAALDQSLADEAAVIAAYVHPVAGGGLRLELPPAVDRALRSQQGGALLYAVLEAGVLRDGVSGFPEAPRVAGDSVQYSTAVIPVSGESRIAWYRWTAGDRPLVLAVARPLDAPSRVMRPLLTTTLALDLLQLGAVIVFVLVGVRQGLLPLLAFRNELRRRSLRDLAPLDERHVPIELRALVESLNALLARVRETTESQQKFLADAAHQLKTPLAGMQAQLDLLAGTQAAAPLRERIEAIQDGLRRLAHTAHQLLTLARAEGVATLERDFVDIDLSALVGDVVAGYVDRALAKRIDVGAETRPARLRGVDWLLRELLGNLVDNALTYTPAGGVVTVRCGEVDGGVFLEVEDDGPGIPPEERPRVLERFHRVPGTVGVGSGLGLSIVSEIAVLHNGHVEIHAGTGGIGTRVRIDFGARRP